MDPGLLASWHRAQWVSSGLSRESGDDRDGGALWRPTEHPLGDVHRQIDAAVAHRRPEVVVPIGTVQGVTLVGEIHHVGHVIDLVGLAADRPRHRLHRQLDENLPVANGRRHLRCFGGASTDQGGQYHLLTLIRPEALRPKRDDNFFRVTLPPSRSGVYHILGQRRGRRREGKAHQHRDQGRGPDRERTGGAGQGHSGTPVTQRRPIGDAGVDRTWISLRTRPAGVIAARSRPRWRLAPRSDGASPYRLETVRTGTNGYRCTHLRMRRFECRQAAAWSTATPAVASTPCYSCRRGHAVTIPGCAGGDLQRLHSS